MKNNLGFQVYLVTKGHYFMVSPVLAKILERPAPLLNFRWKCTSLPINKDLIDYVESITLPMPSLEASDPFFIAGTYIQFPGTYRVESFTLNMYEDENLSVAQWYYDWQRLVRNPANGLYNLPHVYKQQMTFELIKDSDNSVIEFILEGCWPNQLSGYDFNYSESGRIIANLTFSVDSITIDS